MPSQALQCSRVVGFLICLLAAPTFLVAFPCVPSGSIRSAEVRRFAFAMPSLDAISLKQKLLQRLQDFKNAKARDGSISIEFGVKGGELNSTSRAPQKVDYYAVSPAVGLAADRVIATCRQLAECRSLTVPTQYFGNPERGKKLSPLHGPWKLLFTTAADASFQSSNSRRGMARVQNVVDASRGRITNIIDFLPRATESTPRTHNINDSSPYSTTATSVVEPTLKQLQVVIDAKAVSPKRIELKFRYAKVTLSKSLFGLPFPRTLYIPVPASFITRCIVLFYRIFRRGTVQQPPNAYFDVMYLDDDLRIHKTGEDNWFVQAKPSWTEALSLIQ